MTFVDGLAQDILLYPFSLIKDKGALFYSQLSLGGTIISSFSLYLIILKMKGPEYGVWWKTDLGAVEFSAVIPYLCLQCRQESTYAQYRKSYRGESCPWMQIKTYHRSSLYPINEQTRLIKLIPDCA